MLKQSGINVSPPNEVRGSRFSAWRFRLPVSQVLSHGLHFHYFFFGVAVGGSATFMEGLPTIRELSASRHFSEFGASNPINFIKRRSWIVCPPTSGLRGKAISGCKRLTLRALIAPAWRLPEI